MKGYYSSRLSAANQDYQRREDMDFANIQVNIAPHLPEKRDTKLLEIGFGQGRLLDYLKSAGYTSYEGLEVDEECFELCKPVHPVSHSNDPVAFLAARPENYDAIILRNVIAHIPRELVTGYLATIKGALKPGGVLLIETFNAALLSSSYTFYNDFTHRVMYSEYSLRQLLILGGFEEIDILGVRITLKQGLRAHIYLWLQSVWHRGLSVLLGLERGFGGNPTIYNKLLLAVVRKAGS